MVVKNKMSQIGKNCRVTKLSCYNYY